MLPSNSRYRKEGTEFCLSHNERSAAELHPDGKMFTKSFLVFNFYRVTHWYDRQQHINTRYTPATIILNENRSNRKYLSSHNHEEIMQNVATGLEQQLSAYISPRVTRWL